MTYFSKASLALGLITSLMAPFISSAQLSVTPSGSAASLAAALAGPGVTIVSDTLICNNSANGTFTSVATPIGLPNGILLSTGRASAASGAETGLTSSGFGGAGDADLRALLGTATTSYDACALILHVVPAGDTLKFRYQFGSEEYIQSTCGNFNDAFAFYISGPGITSSLPGVNMALVPGTNIPVAVNSINSGTPGSRGNIANCTAMGSGSPFTSYYIDNTGGSSLSYRGYTTVLTAIHEVNPCDTYRLKMVITDANNDIYDSGVFIEGGSLSSNTYSFSRVDALGNTINGIPHAIVRGCTPATVKILAGHTVTSATTVHYTESGSATSGRDFARLADSVIIPAGAAEATFNVTALTASTGIKTLTLRLVPQFSCGLPDSITLTILDSPSAAILTPDTAICGSDGVLIRTTSSTGVAFSWSPAAGLDNAGIAQPTASPTSPVTYIMSATLPGSGCAPIIDSIHIGKDNHSAYILTPDTSICPGNIVQIRVAAGDSTVFSWTPSLGLNSDTAREPFAYPSVSTSYEMTATAPGGCISRDTINITVADVRATIATPDTMICAGQKVQIIASVTSPDTVTLTWLPTAGIANYNVMNPLVAPDTSAMYYLYGYVKGCGSILDSVFIDVQPRPTVYMGGNRFICQFDTLHINANVLPAWYSHYSYSWYPATGLDYTNTPTVVFTANGSTDKYFVDVTTPAGCLGRDSAIITVYPGNFATPGTNWEVCPHDTVQFSVTGADHYAWHPTLYLSDSTIGNPYVAAITSQTYEVIAFSTNGCRDTVTMRINVWPGAVVYLEDSVRLYPGEQVHLQPYTTCTSLTWFPPQGLSDWQVTDPIATPDVDTRFYVYGTTDHGCKVVDSIDIFVNPDALIQVPNAFAPGAEANGTFKIISLGTATLNHFRIYNRWGNLVFETKDIAKGWDGMYNGTPQPQDVYVYDLEAVTISGKIIRRHGNITLIR